MANDMKNVRGEYVFFAAYLAQDKEEDAWEVNGRMLSNFLTALEKTGALNDVKRIILVCGAKQYGVHLGMPKQPMLEDAPWLTDTSKWPPNFYYNQQNILHKFCEEKGKEWVVTYPNDVIGFAMGNFMNLSSAVALYALVSKELSPDGLVFPGSPDFYTKFDSFTNSKLHAEFCAWAALEPRAANQAFNVVNGDVESWQNLWPKIADYFGTKVKPDQFKSAYSSGISSSLSKLIGGDASSTMDMAAQPPISVEASTIGLEGTPALQPNKVEQQIDLVKWSQRSDVKEAWERIAEREGLDKENFDKATWGFLGFCLGRKFDLVISMSKARECGWTGYRDTWHSLKSVFDEMKKGGVLPKA
jgi:nucleoside-diphosphate-sugar epimerase